MEIVVIVYLEGVPTAKSAKNAKKVGNFANRLDKARRMVYNMYRYIGFV